MEPSRVLDFVFELGMLGRLPRAGWLKIGSGVEDVAQHVLRTAQLAYVLAVMEGNPNPEHVMALAMVHDNAETRTGDPHRLAKRYVVVDAAEATVEQTADFGEAGRGLLALWIEQNEKVSPEAIIAKDADLLEMAISACELNASRGNDRAQAWIDGVLPMLKTKSAFAIAEQLATADPDAWWKAAEGS